MFISRRWLLILTLTGIHAQEPRKRNSNGRYSYEEPFLLEQNNEDDVSCSAGGCVKRSPGQDEFGPFWANRGKKDPTYSRSKLYVEEPHWILVRRDDSEPFWVTRGKKNIVESSPKSVAAQMWKNLFAPTTKKFKYLQHLEPYFLETGRKDNGEKTANFQ